jgi:putative spermidine/putrescine transport system substrate-binding protein
MSEKLQKKRFCPDGLKMTRRRFITAMGAAAVSSAVSGPLILIPGKAKASEDRVVVATWGGSWLEGSRKAFFDSFETATGIKVITTSAPDMAKIYAQHKANNVEIDVAELIPSWIVPAEQKGVLARVNPNIVNREGVLPEAVRDFEVGYCTYAQGIAYHAERHPEGKHPTNWPEFWDAKKFPGRRGLRTRVSEQIEAALMADGVHPKKVYPCDVERAFRSLDRIKPHVSHFIKETAKTISLIQQNECDFTYAAVNRVFRAKKAGLPINFSYKQNMIGIQFAAALKNSPNPTGAQKLLAWYLNPEGQAKFANFMCLAPVIPAVRKKVDPEILPQLPDPLAPDACIKNLEWWAGKAEKLQKRYTEWLMS